MRFKQEFVLRNIAGESIIIPISDANNSFQGVMSLNETGESIWKAIEKGLDREGIIEVILEEYEVTREHAAESVDRFLANLNELGILEP